MTTLKDLSFSPGDLVRRMLMDRAGNHYPEPLLWEVLSVERHGCVVALAGGQGHAPHKHLMEWGTKVEGVTH